MSQVTFLDRPPAGWFPLDVMRTGDHRKREWCALMVDVDPADLKNCMVEFPALFYVDPKTWEPAEDRTARQEWVRIPGKHRNRDAAFDALEAMLAASPAVSEARQ